MKSSIWCAFMIAMFFVASAAFGEIVITADWDSDGGGNWGATGNPPDSNIYANAVGEDPSSWAEAEGWLRYTVTEDTYCDWNYTLEGYSYVDVYRNWPEVGPHSAYAWSYAYVNSPHCTDYAVTWAYIDETTSWYDWDKAEDEEDDGSGLFYENDSLYFNNQVGAEADITENSDEDAFARAIAYAGGNLKESR